MDNKGTSPLEVANPSYNTSVEDILNETNRLIDFASPDRSPARAEVPSQSRSPARAEVPSQSKNLAQVKAVAQFKGRNQAELETHIKVSPSSDLNLDKRLITRSQVTESFEHIELDFPRKVRTKKMAPSTVTIRLEDAFKLIPLCTGIDDIYQFINACDMVVSLVEEANAPTLVKYITTRLTGRALEMIKYKNVTKWAYIKSYLTDAFEDTTTASTLQIQLNSIRMRNNEEVNEYCHRVEKLYYQLCTVSTLNKLDSEAKVIHETLKEQTLAIFIKGLIEPIRTIVKARNPKTLEIAKQLAKAEEVEYLTERETTRYRNDYSNNKNNSNFGRNNSNNFQRINNTRLNNSSYNNRNNGNFRPNNFTRSNTPIQSQNYRQPNNNNYKPVIKCYHCNGNHYATQCRNKPGSNYINNSNSRPPNRNNFTQPPTNYNIQVVACAYCNRAGHNINDCYKKRNDENRNNNSGNGNVSNAERGTRSINQIIAEQPVHDAFTSSQL